jgi:hypothetical protein
MKAQPSKSTAASDGQAGPSNRATHENRSDGQFEGRFDPSRFRMDPAFVDSQADLIPAEREPFLPDRNSGKFVIVPVAAQEFYPAAARTLNLLAYLSRMHVPDLEGGWYKLTTGRTAGFQLTKRNSRSRAITTLEAKSVIEVKRTLGKSPYIRLAPQAAAKFQIDLSNPRRRVACKKQQLLGPSAK